MKYIQPTQMMRCIQILIDIVLPTEKQSNNKQFNSVTFGFPAFLNAVDAVLIRIWPVEVPINQTHAVWAESRTPRLQRPF